MTKRAKIIIGALIAALLGAGVVAGLLASSGITPTKSSNQIKGDIEKAFEGKDYFKEVKVKSYDGMNEEENGDIAADSAAIVINFNKMDSETFKEAAALLPELKMSAFYSFSVADDISSVTSVTGFRNSDFKNEETVNAIAGSLKVRDSYDGPYWQITRGDAEGNNADKLKTQFVTKATDVESIRKTVDSILTPKMDVLPVMKSELSEGSFAQFAAVDGKMTNYNKGLEIGLKFADAAFIDGKDVVLLGLGDTIQVSYTSLREGLTKDKLVEIGKELNKDQLFKINVVSPEDAAKTTPEAEPESTESASPSASTSASPTTSPSAEAK